MSVAELTPQADSTSKLDVETLKQEIIRNLKYSVGKSLDDAEPRDLYTATALAVRQPLLDAMRTTEQRYAETNSKRVYYISMEFLMGKSLENNLINLRLLEACRQALVDLGVDLDLLMETEPDAGLGNGGLGRLAACFIDSIATLGIAGYGYGINYEYGLFKQEITNGWQLEKPDNWLQHGTPWQIERVGESVVVPLYGTVDFVEDRHGNTIPSWRNWQAVVGVPHDMPIVGFNGDTVNYLRLFSARGSQDFDMDVFNGGDYIRAVEGKIRGETISKVLYPSDAVLEGKELRLVQEYFMVACCIRDLIRRHEKQHDDIYSLSEFAAIQLNDTHPALAVAELMRLLLDERDMTWDDAWSITTSTLAYTNHTLLPEALEKWSVSLIGRVLPRHLQIIFEINARFLDEVKRKWPDDVDRVRAMSIIEEVDNGDNQVRMCNLAIVGSHSVNGVSALHSELVKSDLVPAFYEHTPEKFNNKTNGITPRRWLLQCNRPLSSLISSTIGESWITDLDQLRALEEYAADEAFQNAFQETNSVGKRELARIIKSSTGI